jgi:7-cyano-7-deazaguanine synthase in queuosine biosynthesis
LLPAFKKQEMTYTNLICDYELHAAYRRLIKPKETTIYLSADAAFGNVYLKPEAIAQALGTQLDPVSLDLCEIAAYVYMGDKAVSRGKYEKWTRNLSWIVPVREPERWNSVKDILTNTISTLSGDNVRFTFVPRSKPKDAAKSRLKKTKPSSPLAVTKVPESDCSCLFSGGLDSFAGAAYLIDREERRPLFASHCANGELKNKQIDLMNVIENKFGQNFHHFQYWVTSKRNQNTPHKYVRQENSHRARSFLFMSFATVAAASRGLSDIFICENGVLSLNVPISDARKGSRSTRHAHPLYLFHFNQLINALYERKFNVQNPFSLQTKGEEIALLKTLSLESAIKDTVTCWGYPNQTCRYKYSNHCGYCIPCVVRRVSLIAAGMEECDDQYVVDVFGLRDKLTERQLRNVEDLAYFCQNFSTLSKTELLYRFPELVMIEAGNGSASGDRIEKIICVYKEFAREFALAARQLNSDLAADFPETPSEALLAPASVSEHDHSYEWLQA